LANVNLGKVVEKIIGKIRGEEETAEPLLDIPTTSAASGVPLARVVTHKVYLKSSVLRSLGDLDNVKNEVKSGNILVLRVDTMAEKSMDDVKRAISELAEFVGQIGGDIARLGEERIVVTPSFVKVWREKSTESEGLKSRTST